MPLNRWKVSTVGMGGQKKILMTRVFQHIVYVGIHRDYLPWTEWEGSDGNSAVFIYIIWNVIRQTEGFRPSVYNNRRTYNIHAYYSYCCRQNARPIVNNREMFISVAARFAMVLVKGNTLVSEIKRRFVNYFRFDKVSLWYITAFKTVAYVRIKAYYTDFCETLLLCICALLCPQINIFLESLKSFSSPTFASRLVVFVGVEVRR